MSAAATLIAGGLGARWLRSLRLVAVALAMAASASAQAGRSCEERPPTQLAIQRGLALAEHTADVLDATGARVVALARAGQDLTEYGLRYSHFGFAYREELADGSHVWRVVHKLNQCATAIGSLYRQGLGEFFLDDPWRYEAAVVVLAPEVQEQLLPVLTDNARVARLDTPAYSVVAYPWSQRYQQSNQWAIETLAMAEEPAATTRENAQAWLRLHGYEPTTLHLSAFKRLGARLTAANVAFDDHPNEKRYSDRIETVTVDSVFAWLARTGQGSMPMVIR